MAEPSTSEPLDNPIRATQADARQRFTEAIDWAKQDQAELVRVRCDLRLYNRQQEKYVSWNDASWTVDVKANVEHGMALKQAFDAFFERLIAEGPAAVVGRLQTP